eukprot:scaffold62324_cov66-Phaeocystis_antarctica.AAC.4
MRSVTILHRTLAGLIVPAQAVHKLGLSTEPANMARYGRRFRGCGEDTLAWQRRLSPAALHGLRSSVLVACANARELQRLGGHPRLERSRMAGSNRGAVETGSASPSRGSHGQLHRGVATEQCHAAIVAAASARGKSAGRSPSPVGSQMANGRQRYTWHSPTPPR